MTGEWNKDKLVSFLKSDDPAVTEKLFSEARRIRKEIQGDKIFAYGFVYFSTYCRNNWYWWYCRYNIQK